MSDSQDEKKTILIARWYFGGLAATAAIGFTHPLQLIKETTRVARWYFGGLSASAAVCFTHPFDLLKVQLQTQEKLRVGMIPLTRKLIASDGVLALYNGLSASVVRQMTYSLVRFALYDKLKQMMVPPGQTLAFSQKLWMAGISGGLGGLVGVPADLINVRMQNDVRLPRAERRNYKHVFDGLYQVYTKEGIRRLFSGASFASVRGLMMTIGQIAVYDHTKEEMVKTKYFDDNLKTHFTASLFAGTIATIFTQPLDVLKTRLMNAKEGEYKSVFDCFLKTAKLGPFGFLKGFIPAFFRLGPNTILIFVFYEQLRLNFGYDVPVSK